MSVVSLSNFMTLLFSETIVISIVETARTTLVLIAGYVRR
jgi:hypothetical protein